MNTNQMFSKNSFNLFPKDVEKQRKIKKYIYLGFAVLLLINICFALYTLMLSNKMNAIKQATAENQAKIKSLEPVLNLDANIKTYNSELEKILKYEKSITSVEAPMFDILMDIESVIPSDITLNSLTLGEDGKISIAGIAKNEWVVFNFITSLKGLDKLTEVYLKTVTKKEGEKPGEYVNIFNAECKIKGIEKKKK